MPPPAADTSLPVVQSFGAPGCRWCVRAAGISLILLTALVYCNQFTAPLVFDGYPWIYANQKIKTVWPIWSPSMGMMRPVPYLSFSLNYWAGEQIAKWVDTSSPAPPVESTVSGAETSGTGELANAATADTATEPVAGWQSPRFSLRSWAGGWAMPPWHIVNRVIHGIAALALFGLVRRTLLRGRAATRYASHATALAWAITAVWLVHPLQTQSVIYIYQRLESMAGMFFLLSLYSFARSIDSPHPFRWRTMAVIWSVLCMGTKELAVALPVLTLWYDWALVASDWREVAKRWKFHLAMFATWGVLAILILCNLSTYVQGGIGDGAKVTPADYALNQPSVVSHYLKLTVYPIGQNLDYGWRVSHDWKVVLPGILLIGTLAVLTLVAIWRWPGWGFVGGWFFVILAPTSSIVPIADLAFEHRMYLPLASLAVVLVLGVYSAVAAASKWTASDNWLARHAWLLLMLCAVTTLAALAWRRNQQYETAVTIWTDVVAKSPHHNRAHYNLGCAYYAESDWPAAIACYRDTLSITPSYEAAIKGMADAMIQMHQKQQALNELEAFLIVNPNNDAILDYFDSCIAQFTGDHDGIERYERIMAAGPENAKSARLHLHAGQHLKLAGQAEFARLEFEKAIELDPDFAPGHSALAGELFERTEYHRAAIHYQRAVALVPNDSAAQHILGRTLEKLGDVDGAVDAYQEALRLNPDYPAARENLDAILKPTSKAAGSAE